MFETSPTGASSSDVLTMASPAARSRLRSGLRGRPDGVATLSFAAKREESPPEGQENRIGSPW